MCRHTLTNINIHGRGQIKVIINIAKNHRGAGCIPAAAAAAFPARLSPSYRNMENIPSSEASKTSGELSVCDYREGSRERASKRKKKSKRKIDREREKAAGLVGNICWSGRSGPGCSRIWRSLIQASPCRSLNAGSFWGQIHFGFVNTLNGVNGELT